VRFEDAAEHALARQRADVLHEHLRIAVGRGDVEPAFVLAVERQRSEPGAGDRGHGVHDELPE
jgi:hypothetical protein